MNYQIIVCSIYDKLFAYSGHTLSVSSLVIKPFGFYYGDDCVLDPVGVRYKTGPGRPIFLPTIALFLTLDSRNEGGCPQGLKFINIVMTMFVPFFFLK